MKRSLQVIAVLLITLPAVSCNGQGELQVCMPQFTSNRLICSLFGWLEIFF